jgi:hypothetical protein
VGRVVARGHAPQEGGAAQQQPRAHQEHEGEGDLAGDERGTRAAARRPHLRPPALLERGEQRPPAELRGREQSQEQRRERRDGERDEECGPVDARLLEARDAGRREAGDRPYAGVGEAHPRRRAEPREHGALGGELARDPGAPGAERGAERQLAPARHAARRQQVRDVRARDEQHHRAGAEQDEELRAVALG